MGGTGEVRPDPRFLEGVSGQKYPGGGVSYDFLGGKYNQPANVKKGGRGLLRWYDEEVIAPIVDWLFSKMNRGGGGKKVGWEDVGYVISDAMKK